MMETPTRYVVVFQPASLEVPGIPRQIIPVMPHSGMYQVDRATSLVQQFHALPEAPGAEDYWGHHGLVPPLLGGDEERARHPNPNVCQTAPLVPMQAEGPRRHR